MKELTCLACGWEFSKEEHDCPCCHSTMWTESQPVEPEPLNTIILAPSLGSILGIQRYNTVEAEYGSTTLMGNEGGITLAHHGSNSNNPCPCIAPIETPNKYPIVISHIDLDTIGGIMGIAGWRDDVDPVSVSFWELAAFVDIKGPHNISKSGATQDIIDKLNAWYAYNAEHRSEKVSTYTNVTADVYDKIIAINKIIAGNKEMIEAGKDWYNKITEAVESCLIEETEDVRVFMTDSVFCGASYYSPRFNSVAKATVTFNKKFNAITIAFEDGGVEYKSVELVKSLWGDNAGGHAGIAGSPRGQIMTGSDLKAAVIAVKALYEK